MGSEDTHAVVGGLVRRCGGAVVASVPKGSTGLLIVGRGEKGENGKPDGKGGRAGSKRRLYPSVAAAAHWSDWLP